MATLTIEGRLHIGRVTSNQAPDEIWIDLTDEKAATHFAVVKMTLADFARAVTLLDVCCQIEVRGLDRVGRVMEHKTEWIEEPKGAPFGPLEAWQQRMRATIEPFEVDGWRHDAYDIQSRNSHRTKNGKYQVTFRRWVEREETA